VLENLFGSRGGQRNIIFLFSTFSAADLYLSMSPAEDGGALLLMTSSGETGYLRSLSEAGTPDRL
jgi:hypothetical protein